MRFRPDAKFILLGLSALVIFAVSGYPFLVLLHKILFSGEGGAFSLAPFTQLFEQSSLTRAILNTLMLSFAVTAGALIVGVLLSWLLARTDFPMAARFRSLLSLPFAIPPYVGAIAWITLANPSTGLLNRLFHAPLLNVYSFTGLVLVEASFLYTLIFLSVTASLDRMDSSLEEAARLSGAPPWRVLKDVTLPLIRPATLTGLILVFLATAASFGVPALLGGPARLPLITTQIYTLQRMGTTSGLLRAGALSVILLLATLVLLAGSSLILRGRFQTVSGKTPRPSLIELGRWRWPLFALVIGFLVLVLVLPISGIVISSFSRIQGELSFANLTLDTWIRTLFQTEETARSIFNSLSLAATAASIAVALSIPIAYLQIKTRIPGRGVLDLITTIPYAAPGTVVAMALIVAFSGSFMGIFPSLYNTFGLLLLAYVVKYLSFATRTTADGYRQIDDVLAEAAHISGAGWSKTMMTIWLPLLKSSLVVAWFLVFMPVLSELTMSVLLTGPGLETIGTLIFQLQEYADAGGGGASVMALIVVGAAIGTNSLVKYLSNGEYGL